MEYKVLVEELVLDNGITAKKDDVVELDPSLDWTKAAIEQGAIELVPFVEVAGTPCTTFDGKEGTLQGDPLVCVATEPVIVTEEIPAEEIVAMEQATAIIEKKKYYRSLEVIVDGMRTVGDKEYHHITLVDGEEMDMTEDEYTAQVYLA